MKTITLSRNIAFFIFLFLLAGCTKDSTLSGKNENAKSVQLPSEFPVYNAGFIKGMLSPVPAESAIKIYNEKGFSLSNKPFPDGAFYIDNLPEGVYTVQIAYLVKRAEYAYWAYYEIPIVEVSAGKVTSLGTVVLPWTY